MINYPTVERVIADEEHAGCELCYKPARVLYRITGHYELGTVCFACVRVLSSRIVREMNEENIPARQPTSL